MLCRWTSASAPVHHDICDLPEVVLRVCRGSLRPGASGRPAQSPGGNDSAASLWYPSQTFQIRASNMQLPSNIPLTCPVPDLHQPVQVSLKRSVA